MIIVFVKGNLFFEINENCTCFCQWEDASCWHGGMAEEYAAQYALYQETESFGGGMVVMCSSS